MATAAPSGSVTSSPRGSTNWGHDVTIIGVGQRGVQCHFVATSDAPHPEGTEQDTEVELIHAIRAAEALEALTPDIVHDHSRAGPLLAPLRHAPTVVTVHGSVTASGRQRELAAAWGRHAALVAISPAQQREAPDLPWRATIANGIQLEHFVLGLPA